jgi:hypothetical protein
MKIRWLILFGLGLILLIAFLAIRIFVHSADYTLTEANFTKDALIVVKTHSLLSLPEKSRGLNMLFEGSHGDPAFVAKIEIPTDTAENVKKQIEMRPNQDYHPIGALSEKVPWWNPAQLTLLAERKYTVDSSYVHVLLCRDNQQIVLFVESLSF